MMYITQNFVNGVGCAAMIFDGEWSFHPASLPEIVQQYIAAQWFIISDTVISEIDESGDRRSTRTVAMSR